MRLPKAGRAAWILESSLRTRGSPGALRIRRINFLAARRTSQLFRPRRRLSEPARLAPGISCALVLGIGGEAKNSDGLSRDIPRALCTSSLVCASPQFIEPPDSHNADIPEIGSGRSQGGLKIPPVALGRYPVSPGDFEFIPRARDSARPPSGYPSGHL